MWTKRERKKPTPNYAILRSARKAMNEGEGRGTNFSVIVREGGGGQRGGGSRSSLLSHGGKKEASFQ